jgi:hypothetical protein
VFGVHPVNGTYNSVRDMSQGELEALGISYVPGDPAVSGALIPLIGPDGQPVPGKAVNPNTGAIIDISDPTGSQGGYAPHYAQPYGVVAPDPMGQLQAQLAIYQQQVANGQMTVDQAKDEFDRYSQFIETQLSAQYNKASLDQNAAQVGETLGLDLAKTQESELRAREEARTQRGIQIADTRRLMGQSMVQDFLPSALPASITNLNIPFLGNMPLQQHNPDQLYGVDYLNQIPDIGTQLGPLAGYQVGTIPGGAGITQPDYSQYPTVPNYTPPPIPDFSSLLGQIGQGSVMGWA